MPKADSWDREQVRRIHRTLKRFFRAAGHGSIQRTERELGLFESFYRRRRHEARLDMETLFATLRVLKVEPKDFFAEVYLGSCSKPLSSLRVGGPEEVADSDLLAALPAASASEVPPSWSDWLSEMDRQRFDAPETTLDELRGRAAILPSGHRARFLAICGSCHRSLGSIEDAMRCLQAAAEASTERRSEYADVLQRWSFVLADNGRYRGGLEMSERASGIYSRAHDSVGVSKTWVDQGLFLWELGEHAEATGAEVLALETLPESEPRSRLAAAQYLSMFKVRNNELQEALELCAVARKIARVTSFRRFEGKLLWSEAELCERLGMLDRAASSLARAVEILGPLNPLDGLLASAEHIRILVALKRPARAITAAETATMFIGLLRGNRLAESAVIDLYRAATVARAQIDAVVESIRALRAASRRPHARLGGRVRAARERLGLSRTRAAGSIGMPVSSLRKVETGVTPEGYRIRIREWLDRASPEFELIKAIRRGGELLADPSEDCLKPAERKPCGSMYGP